MCVCDRCVLCVAVVGRWDGSCGCVCVWVVVVLYVEVRVLPGWLRSTTLGCLGFSWRVQIATEGPWADWGYTEIVAAVRLAMTL